MKFVAHVALLILALLTPARAEAVHARDIQAVDGDHPGSDGQQLGGHSDQPCSKRLLRFSRCPLQSFAGAA